MEKRMQRILVVDDHPTNRLKMEMSVKRLGYESAPAENGRQALDLLRREAFDLVLLDIVMPEMDGYEVLAAIKADAKLRDIPVIIISTLEDLDAVVKAIELGAEDHLPKTFDPVLLKARVGACLEKKQMRDLEVEYLRQVELLTDAASAIEAEDFDPGSIQLDNVIGRNDALGQLARVFTGMAREVYAREQNLKRQLHSLQITVDKARQSKQVNSITGTDYFKELRDKAGDLRAMLRDEKNNSL